MTLACFTRRSIHVISANSLADPQRSNEIFECTILTRSNFIATEISRRHQHINVRCFEQCATYKDLQHFATHSAIATVGYRCRVADRSSAAGFLIEPMW